MNDTAPFRAHSDTPPKRVRGPRKATTLALQAEYLRGRNDEAEQRSGAGLGIVVMAAMSLAIGLVAGALIW